MQSYEQECVVKMKTEEKELSVSNLCELVVSQRAQRPFESLELNNRKVIDQIYRKERIYHGDFVDGAPDLVLMANTGFDLKARIKAEELIEESIFTGKHNQHDAFLFVKGNVHQLAILEEPSVFDIVKILEADRF